MPPRAKASQRQLTSCSPIPKEIGIAVRVPRTSVQPNEPPSFCSLWTSVSKLYPDLATVLGNSLPQQQEPLPQPQLNPGSIRRTSAWGPVLMEGCSLPEQPPEKDKGCCREMQASSYSNGEGHCKCRCSGLLSQVIGRGTGWPESKRRKLFLSL